MQPWKAIVFDLDDTLYPERDYVLSGFKAVARWAASRLPVPYEQGFAELQCLFERGVRRQTFNLWLAAHRLPAGEELLTQLVRVYREHEPELEAYPEVPALLQSLRQRGCRLGLVSDGYLAVQRRKLAALGLERFFDAVVFSDQWGREHWKPSTKPFSAVLETLACDGAHSLYVADNPLKDFHGARKLGMGTVRVQRPTGEYARLAPPGPDYAPDWTFSSLAEFSGPTLF